MNIDEQAFESDQASESNLNESEKEEILIQTEIEAEVEAGVEPESELTVNSKISKDSLGADSLPPSLDFYPQEITTRLSVANNYVAEDQIQNLKVTLVPITKPASTIYTEEVTSLRSQSPVCDFIQRVLLESYV